MMNTILGALPLLGTGTLLMVPLFAGDPLPGEISAEVITKAYDLSFLQARRGEPAESREYILFPSFESRARTPLGHWTPMGDGFSAFAEDVLWEEIEYDGRTWQPLGMQSLVMGAPEATHDDLESLIDFYAGLTSEESLLQLSWVRIPSGDSSQPTTVGIIGDAAAQEILTLAEQNGWPVIDEELHVPSYSAGVVQEQKGQHVLMDANVEIASGSATLDAAMIKVRSGHWALVNAVPRPDGLMTSLTWAYAHEPVLRAQDLGIKALLGSESETAGLQELGGVLQLISQGYHVGTQEVLLKEGEAWASSVASDVAGEKLVLIVRTKTRSKYKQTYQLKGARKDRGVAFLQRSMLPVRSDWQWARPLTLFEGIEVREKSLAWLSQEDDSNWMVSNALEGVARDLLEVREAAGYMLLYPARGIPRDQLPVAHMELDRAIERLESAIPPSERYEVSIRGTRPDGTEFLSIEQVISEGSQGIWFSGSGRSYISDYDVEVAQKSAVHDPEVNVMMEGAFVKLRLTSLPSGQLRAHWQADIGLPEEDQTINFGSAQHGSFERRSYSRAQFDTVLSLTGTEPGIWTGALGSAGGGAMGLTLNVKAIP